MEKAIWLDCDPGHDDALAIILAGHHRGLKLLGISTVAGNQTVDKVTRNALGVLAAAGLTGIDVVRGQAAPLMRPPQQCPAIHGETGLCFGDGRSMQDYATGHPLPGKAANVMFARISAEHRRSGQFVELVCTGALTNAALLFLMYPEVVPLLRVTVMGGAMGVGNTGPVAEFNIQTDPEAARVVFSAGAALTMVPLEVTHTALATPAIMARIAAVDSAFARTMSALLQFFAHTYRDVFSFAHPPLHDPLAVFAVACPAAFKVKAMRVDIETCSSLSAGQTVCDVWDQSSLPKNANVALSVDVDAFWDAMIAAILEADAVSPLNEPLTEDVTGQ